MIHHHNKNNSKPAPSFKVPAWIPVTMKLLEKAFPKLALKLALKIFFRPIPFKTPPKELKWQRKASVKTLYADGLPFTVYRWNKKGKKILLVHGWSGRGTQFYKLIKKLLEKGYQPIAIDAPGHGRFPSKFTDLVKFIQAIEVTSASYGPFYAMVGHSLGGVAIANAAHGKVHALKMVIIASPARISYTVRDFCARIGTSESLQRALYQTLEQIYGSKIHQYSLAEVVKGISIPGLVIHDTDDEDVHYGEAIEIHNHWPGSRLHTTSGLGHRRVLRDKAVIKRILRFLDKNPELKSLTDEQIRYLIPKKKPNDPNTNH